MFKLVTIWFLLFSSYSFAQNPDLGKIKTYPNHSCKGDLLFDTRSIDSLYGLDNICSSTNYIEIRVGIMYHPTPIFDLIVLSFTGNSWFAKRFHGSLADVLYGDKREIEVYTLVSKYGLDSVFNYLKENQIFNLPNQYEIKPDGLVDDGAYFYLTFKAGSNFGSYRFNNPDSYAKTYKDIPQFSNFAAIQEVFEQWLKKE